MKQLVLAAVLSCVTLSTFAQAPQQTVIRQVRTFKLTHATNQAEQNEVLTAIRNVGGSNLRVFLVPSSGEIVVNGSPEEIAMVADLIAKLDVTQPTYRLTYTFIETDGGKRIGQQSFALMVAANHAVDAKEGSKVPIITSSSEQDHRADRTYLDVGFETNSEVAPYGEQVKLKARISWTSLAEGPGPTMVGDPVIRQTRLEGYSVLTPGKQQSIGSMDVVGSTRHTDVQALVEVLR